MKSGNNKESLLSSWKEIATYLECDKRTAIRWEKSMGLPVHRLEGEGVKKPRIYAYKKELDQWLEERLHNNDSRHKSKTNRPFLLKALWIGLPITILCAFLILILPLNNDQNSIGTHDPGVPQSTGPLTLQEGDIVSTEFSLSGTLRVWRKDTVNSYKEVWKIHPVRHASVAVADIDGDGRDEIIGTAICRELEPKGDRTESSYRFFLNVYKDGVKDWWKTTFFSKADCVYEGSNFEVAEITCGDVDGLPGNEIIIITKRNLAVFGYDPGLDEIKLMRSRDSFFDDKELFLKSVALVNVDADPAKEIIVTADEWKDQGAVPNKGWLMMFKVEDSWLVLIESIPVDANLAYQSLRAGDIIKGEGMEIVTPGYRNNQGKFNSFILVYGVNGERLADRKLFELDHSPQRYVHLDVGNLAEHEGEEILVGHHAFDELVYYYWDGSDLVEGSRYPLGNNQYVVSLTNILINDTTKAPDQFSEVILCGAGETDDQAGRMFLELLGFHRGFFPKWRRVGGEQGDIEVSYVAVGRDLRK